MEIKIITEKENGLLGRKEFQYEIEFQGATPKTADVKKEIATLAKSQEDLVVVKAIKNKYGEEKADVFAYVYNSLDELKKLEEYVEPVVEEKKVEESKEDTPAEATSETKEEAPAEVKKAEEAKE